MNEMKRGRPTNHKKVFYIRYNNGENSFLYFLTKNGTLFSKKTISEKNEEALFSCIDLSDLMENDRPNILNYNDGLEFPHYNSLD